MYRCSLRFDGCEISDIFFFGSDVNRTNVKSVHSSIMSVNKKINQCSVSSPFHGAFFLVYVDGPTTN